MIRVFHAFVQQSALSVTKEPRTHPLEGERPSREALIAALAECERELAEARRRERATAELLSVKTRDLEESLQQQTATADVLRVISRSAFDLDAVLKTLTESARSLSGVATALLYLRDGEVWQLRASS
jgi:hypothetical protein